jgi:hypothetical protein
VEFADAEGDGFFVDGFVVAEEGDMRGVERGMIEVPEIGIGDANYVFEVGGAVGGYDFGEEFCGVLDGFALRRVEGYVKADLGAGVAVVGRRWTSRGGG